MPHLKCNNAFVTTIEKVTLSTFFTYCYVLVFNVDVGYIFMIYPGSNDVKNKHEENIRANY